MDYIFVRSPYRSLLYLLSYYRRYPPPPLPPPAAVLRLDTHSNRYNLIIERETSSITELQATPAALNLKEGEMKILLKR
jgi:hypothetical protein